MSSSPTLPAGPAALFEAGEHVLAYHGASVYEAKVLSTTRAASGAWSYLIHYAGWKASWDEWVDSERLMVLSDANREKARQSNESARLLAAKSRRGGGGGARKGGDDAADVGSGGGAKRRRVDAARETEDDGSSGGGGGGGAPVAGGLRLTLPFPLKRILVDDWDFVTQRHMLLRVPLPTSVPSVASILDGYLAHAGSPDVAAAAAGGGKAAGKRGAAGATGRGGAAAAAAAATAPDEAADAAEGDGPATSAARSAAAAAALTTATAVVEGVRSYFDRALSSFLLYRFERPQYDALQRAQRSGGDAPRMSQLYGCAHLLRLFVKLPELVEASFVSQEQADALTLQMNDVLRYINKNAASLFSQEHYAKASPVYIRAFETETGK